MEQIESYLFMFCVIIAIGQLFRSSAIPIALILLIAGVLISFLPFVPQINLNPHLVLDIFLPLLVYESSAFSSWRDIKKNIRPIALLSIGHVIFITILVAVCAHALIPDLGWPLAFILGAAISPPDDVAIFSIAEHVRIPERVFVILEGEALFNDAMALIFFRFALIALITHEFSAIAAGTTFFAIIIGETLYGFLLGNLLGKLRQRLTNPIIHTIASVVTPFLAYIPMVRLGGSGIIATAIVGFIIGNQYAIRFTPEFRLISRGIWPALAFALQSLLFFWVGFNIKVFLEGITSLSLSTLSWYAFVIVALIITGRFVWEFVAVSFLPRLLFPFWHKHDSPPPWQDLFLISWAGMRGSISLAIVLSLPFLSNTQNGVNPRDLVIFLVCCVVIATLVLQGLTLPWIIKKIGIHQQGQREKYNEHVAELSTRIKMTRSALRWLLDYRTEIKDNQDMLDEIKVYIRQYKMLLKRLKNSLSKHDLQTLAHNEEEERTEGTCILLQIIEIERKELLKLWRMEKINLFTRNKLMAKLDHQIQNITN
jgi:CPA1 family monovalent cation:H+ antiporter